MEKVFDENMFEKGRKKREMKCKKIYSALMASALCATSIVPQISIAHATNWAFEYNGVTNMYTDDLADAARQFLNHWNANDSFFTIYYYAPHTSELSNKYYKILIDEASKYSKTGLSTEGDYVKYGTLNKVLAHTQEYKNVDPSTGAISYLPYIDFTFTIQNSNNSTWVKSRISSIINNLNLQNDATQYNKVMAVYDYVRSNITYNGSSNSVDDVVKSSSPTGNSLSCSLFIYRVLSELGVEVRIVDGGFPMGISGEGNHYWNIVNLDGKWYHIDSIAGVLYNSDNYFLTTANSAYHGNLSSEFTTGTFASEHPFATTPYDGSGAIGDPIVATDYYGTIKSYLKLNKDIEVPSLNVSYSVSNGTADEAKGLLAGVDANKITITNSNFNNTMSKVSTGNDTVSLSENEVYVMNTLAVSLNNMLFNAPGVYRYVITQNATNNASITPNTQTLNMNVSVERDGLTYRVVGITFDNNNSKTDGFVLVDTDTPTSEVKTYDLVISNSTTGNGSDVNKYFEYNVSISGLTPNKTYTINGGLNNNNPTSITADSNGAANTKVWLKDKDVIRFNSLDENAHYSITKVNTSDNYTTTNSNNTNSNLVSNTVVTFTNNKELNVDTGVVTKVAPFAFLSAFAMGGLAIFKKKKENN